MTTWHPLHANPLDHLNETLTTSVGMVVITHDKRGGFYTDVRSDRGRTVMGHEDIFDLCAHLEEIGANP